MSTTRVLSVFVDCSADLDRVRFALEEIVGHSFTLVMNEWGANYDTRAFSIEWRVYRDHGIEDDDGIPYSSYAYQIQLTPLRLGATLNEFLTMYESIASFVASKLVASLGGRSLVIANYQHVVAAFGLPKL